MVRTPDADSGAAFKKRSRMSHGTRSRDRGNAWTTYTYGKAGTAGTSRSTSGHRKMAEASRSTYGKAGATRAARSTTGHRKMAEASQSTYRKAGTAGTSRSTSGHRKMTEASRSTYGKAGTTRAARSTSGHREIEGAARNTFGKAKAAKTARNRRAAVRTQKSGANGETTGLRVAEADHEGNRTVRTMSRRRTTAMSLQTVAGMLVIIAVMTVILLYYIKLQADVTGTSQEIAELEQQLTQIRAENDAAYNEINDSISLEEVRKRAILDLGMKYADRDQVIIYSGTETDTVHRVSSLNEN